MHFTRAWGSPVYAYLPQGLSVSLSLSLIFFLSLSISVSFSVSEYLSLSLPVSVSLSVSCISVLVSPPSALALPPHGPSSRTGFLLPETQSSVLDPDGPGWLHLPPGVERGKGPL